MVSLFRIAEPRYHPQLGLAGVLDIRPTTGRTLIVDPEAASMTSSDGNYRGLGMRAEKSFELEAPFSRDQPPDVVLLNSKKSVDEILIDFREVLSYVLPTTIFVIDDIVPDTYDQNGGRWNDLTHDSAARRFIGLLSNKLSIAFQLPVNSTHKGILRIFGLLPGIDHECLPEYEQWSASDHFDSAFNEVNEEPIDNDPETLSRYLQLLLRALTSWSEMRPQTNAIFRKYRWHLPGS